MAYHRDSITFNLQSDLFCDMTATAAAWQDGMIMLLQLVVHFPEPRVGKDMSTESPQKRIPCVMRERRTWWL